MKHLHHYEDGICTGRGAVPAPCGERQVYRPPTGSLAMRPDPVEALARLLAEEHDSHCEGYCYDRGHEPYLPTAQEFLDKFVRLP